MATTTIPSPPKAAREQTPDAAADRATLPDTGWRDLALSEFSVKSPTIPIPFHELLKVVALVDRDDVQTRQLLEHIGKEKYQIEVSANYDRDVSEDADVGAYILLIDGDRREKARNLGRAVRALGRLLEHPALLG